MIHKIKALHDNGKGLSIRAIRQELGVVTQLRLQVSADRCERVASRLLVNSKWSKPTENQTDNFQKEVPMPSPIAFPIGTSNRNNQ